MQNQQPHKRRVRYSGTHPKKFSEKYKEHNPEKYKETIEKVISKGNTPAGMHISIFVKEILDFLEIKKGQIGIDATLGYGGHTSKMLEALQGEGHIYGLDVDVIEIEKTTQRLHEKGFSSDVFTPINTNFANIEEVCNKYGKFDFILADLGVSSMQIDDPERGFSFKREGPLDLRLNPSVGITAAQRLHDIKKEELEAMLIENSDEPLASLIASECIKRNKNKQYITTTSDLKDVVETVISNTNKKLNQEKRKELVKKTCQRVFQALRIDINNEFQVLYEFLDSLPNILKPGGRVAILTFHSGEDRLVKKAFKSFYKDGLITDYAKDIIRPSIEECRLNPRASSTKMRWAIK